MEVCPWYALGIKGQSSVDENLVTLGFLFTTEDSRVHYLWSWCVASYESEVASIISPCLSNWALLAPVCDWFDLLKFYFRIPCNDVDPSFTFASCSLTSGRFDPGAVSHFARGATQADKFDSSTRPFSRQRWHLPGPFPRGLGGALVAANVCPDALLFCQFLLPMLGAAARRRASSAAADWGLNSSSGTR